jgi:AcrR family transcriptional regulator
MTGNCRKNTRQILLETAAELFATHGFKGTSVKMIAQKTGQNIAAVNYHFGSKQNLFIQTLKTVLEKIMTPVIAPNAKKKIKKTGNR